MRIIGSLVRTPRLVKVQVCMMAYKLQNCFQNFGWKIFPKIFLVQTFRQTFIFGHFVVKKFDKSSEPTELNRPRDACNSAKWLQYNPIEMVVKIFKISPPPPNSENRFFGPKNGKKWSKRSKIFRFFFDRNRFRMFKSVFYLKQK